MLRKQPPAHLQTSQHHTLAQLSVNRAGIARVVLAGSMVNCLCGIGSFINEPGGNDSGGAATDV